MKLFPNLFRIFQHLSWFCTFWCNRNASLVMHVHVCACFCLFGHVYACLCMCMQECARVYMLSSDQNPLCCTLNLPHNSWSFGSGSGSNNGAASAAPLWPAARCSTGGRCGSAASHFTARHTHPGTHTQAHTSSESLQLQHQHLQLAAHNQLQQKLPPPAFPPASVTPDPVNLLQPSANVQQQQQQQHICMQREEKSREKKGAWSSKETCYISLYSMTDKSAQNRH